jgi:glycosyltransferase involved in cell wall biosynthesis
VENSGINRREGGRRIKGLPVEQSPVVSIITATFNCCATLEQTLRSVIAQTYPSREYIVIDGGSTDGTVEILGSFDSSIDYWISEPDRGIYDALNKGIGLARGEWIYILGADDRFADGNVLQTVFSRPYQSKLIYGNVIYGDNGIIYDGEFSKQKLLHQNICQQAVFYHRDLFISFGKFELNYPLVADWVFNMRLFASKSVNPLFIDTTVAFYSTEGSSSTVDDHSFNRDRLRLIRSIFGFKYYLSARYDLAKAQLAAIRKKYLRL